MMNASNDSYIDGTDFFDAELPNLSGRGDLDVFEFTLEEEKYEEHDVSSGTDIFASSLGLEGMDIQFDPSESWFDPLESCDVVREVKARWSSDNDDIECSSRREERDRSASLNRVGQQREFQMEVFNANSNARHRQRQQLSSQHQGQTRGSPPSTNRPVLASVDAPERPEARYGEAARKLAECMKLTEATRQHVIMQRDMLGPEEQSFLYLAKEQLNRKRRQQVPPQNPPQVPLPVTASFFNSTLTNGLEQSRKKIGMYMGQVNHKTL